MKRPQTPKIITEQAELDEACAQLAKTGWFAFDTEFVGEKHYLQEICLIQAATDSACFLIDPLGGLDVSPFWKLVADEDIEVVVHAGSEDLSICWRQGGERPTNVFDLQVAAGLVGYGYPTGLARLGRLTTGVNIHKGQTLSDWQQRPLTPEQIEYAVEDVVHLPGIHRHLRDCLASMGRDSWMQEETAVMCDPANLEVDTTHKVKRLRGTGSLSPRALASVHAMIEEREKLAQEYDRPPRTVLRDHLLVEVAKRGWTDIQQIRSLRGVSLNNEALRRLAGAVKAGRSLPEEELPKISADNNEDSPQEDVLLTLVGAVLRDFCVAKKLAYSLLANKQDLRELVRMHTRRKTATGSCSLKSGWRKTAVGNLLDQILSGTSTIRVISVEGKPALEIE